MNPADQFWRFLFAVGAVMLENRVGANVPVADSLSEFSAWSGTITWIAITTERMP
jgi:hypothetical protein